jgi:excisionase family DNA binding protein
MLSVKQIAKELNVSKRTVYRFIKSGKLKAHKLEYIVRIYEADYKAFKKTYLREV